MNIFILNGKTQRATLYRPCELAKDARRIVKGRGRLVQWHVEFVEGASARIAATYEDKAGLRACVTEVI